MSRILSFNGKPIKIGGKFMSDFQSLNSFPSLKCWFSARNQVGISNGTAQQVWQDGSANGVATNQATAGARPAFTTGVINSLPAWLFDAVNDVMTITPLDLFRNKTGFTVHTVFQRTNTGLSLQGIIEAYSSNAQTRVNIYCSSVGQLVASCNRGTDTSVFMVTNLPNDTKWHVASVLVNYTGNTAYLILDGNIVSTATIGGTSGANSENVNGGGVTVMGFAAGSGRLGGYIAEVVIYDTIHTLAQAISAQSTLRRIYGGIP